MTENEKFGVILILPQCAFSAELTRGNISEMMKTIDRRLTEEGAPDEIDARCEMMMDSALAISSAIANHEVEHESGVADIAYCFVYALGKSIGFEQINELRGLTGSYLRNQFLLNPCLNEIDYQQEERCLSKKLADHEASGDDEWDFGMSVPPTIH